MRVAGSVKSKRQMCAHADSSCCLQGRPIAKRIIVVTPSTLTQNWAAEVRKWLTNERCKAIVVQPGPDAAAQVCYCHLHILT